MDGDREAHDRTAWRATVRSQSLRRAGDLGVDARVLLRRQQAKEVGAHTVMQYLRGSHTDWRMPSRPMAVDVASDGHVRLVEQIRFPHATMYDGRSGNPLRKREEFQIVLGLAWDRRFFPAGGSDATIWGHWVHQQAVNVGGPPSMAQAGGPGQGHGRNFAVEGPPGAVLDIFFDPVACEVACDIVKPIW
mmetsp:Transcript_8690/g.24507  ORF Transcript_8690/g.24507 Transcript_8690/m.24507 type:complete len:190 (+) Transcript_8690:1014-1583(+)